MNEQGWTKGARRGLAVAGILALVCALAPAAAMATEAQGLRTGETGTVLVAGRLPAQARASEVGMFYRTQAVGGGAWATSAAAGAAVLVPATMAGLRRAGCGCAYASSGVVANLAGALWAAKVGQQMRDEVVVVGAWAVSRP